MSNQKNQAETNFISIRHVAMNAKFLEDFFNKFSSVQTLKILNNPKTGPKLLNALKNFSTGIERIYGEPLSTPPHHLVSPRKTVASTSREVVPNFSSSSDDSSSGPSNTVHVPLSDDVASFQTYNLTEQNQRADGQYRPESSVTPNKQQGERQATFPTGHTLQDTPDAHQTGSQRVKISHIPDIQQGTKDADPPRTPIHTDKREESKSSPQFTPTSNQSPLFHLSSPNHDQGSPQFSQEKSSSATPRRLNFVDAQDDESFLQPLKDSHRKIFASTPRPGAEASNFPRSFRMTIQSPNQTGIRAIEADEELSYIEVEKINEIISRISPSGDFAANKTVIVSSKNSMIAPGKYEIYRVKRIRV